MNAETGKWLIVAGLMILLAGLIIYFFHDKLHWLGKLPGDILIEKENFRLYIPVTSMIIASIVLTLILNFLKKILH